AVVSSYQVAHGTARPAPAKSIDGTSPSWLWSKFSEPGKLVEASDRPPTVPVPCVVHAVPLNARTKTWSFDVPVLSVCWKIAHGTFGFPATFAPPTTSAFVGSLFSVATGSLKLTALP